MIEEILTSAVSVVEAFGDQLDAEIFPEEAAIATKFSGKRRSEFIAARICAHRALVQLGVRPSPILTGERGAPLWPKGIVGSITHCTGYCAAAVARACEVSAIGIDAEPNDVLPGGVLDLISLEPERVMVAEFAALRGTCWDRLLFSAKEAVYKAWFPITGRWLDFKDAKITIDPAKGSFSAKILISGAKHEEGDPAGFTGNWLERDGLLMTAIAPLRYA